MKIAIISAGKEVANFYKKQLEYFFADAVEFYTYSIEDRTAYSPKNEDIFLITTISFETHNEILEYIPKDKHIINATITLEDKVIKKLKEFPIGTEAILVNSTKSMVDETIVLMYQKGITNIKFFPYYPGCTNNYEKISLVITPSESRISPKGKKILDIGHRVLDTKTLLELISFTDCEYLLKTERLINYFDEISEDNSGVDSFLAKLEHTTLEFNLILKYSNDGILILDNENNITACNEKVNEFLGKERSKILYKSAKNIFKSIIFDKVKEEKVRREDLVLSQNGARLKLKIIPIIKHNIYISALVIISNSTSQDELVYKNISKILKKGHIARYNFDSIVTKNKAVLKIKEIAKKMSKSKSTILITGDSGTGKELFAHSIHNFSPRKERPFVAINCAALQDTLLESELFGYEEGAFTGAKKGGKTGLFEIANNGTLFLDEIEGMSKNLQFKLLRVIQEREIIKVGGDRMIPIDVRIIAASNEDLVKLVEDKVFRQDLYYRLNTLPITIPPLKERIEDLDILIESFKQDLDFDFIFTKESKSILENYSWPGNIRELRNCIEYLGYLGETIIESRMFPQNIINYSKNNLFSLKQNTNIEKKNLLFEIVNIMILFEKKGKSCGRKAISLELKKKGLIVSEAQVRKVLEEMRGAGLVISNSGRRGSHLSLMGYKKFNLN